MRFACSLPRGLHSKKSHSKDSNLIYNAFGYARRTAFSISGVALSQTNRMNGYDGENVG